MTNIHTIFIFLTYLPLVYTNYTQCGYRDEYGTIWDLSSLYLAAASSDNFYTLPNGAHPQYNATFFINFCGDINAISFPSTANCAKSESQVCVKPSLDNTECETFQPRLRNALTYGYAAYPDGKCYAIAGGESETFIDIAQYDSVYNANDNPQELIIKYNYGDFCNQTGSAANRALIIHMLCNSAMTEIEQGTKVINASSDICDNVIYIESPFGCPIVNGTYIPVIETTQINETQTVTDLDTTTVVMHIDEYSIIGQWAKYDFEGMIVFSVEVRVNIDCSEIEFILISPVNDTWFAVGFGGDYETDDYTIGVSSGEDGEEYGSDDAEHMLNMNGYAIVMLSANDVYESMLEAGMVPKRQVDLGATEDLKCDGKELDGVRRVVCKRAYETIQTNDPKFDDFYKFFVGANPMIYAYGTVGNDGIPMQHGVGGYGEEKVHFIYMEQKGELCGYAEVYNKQTDEMDGISEKEMWMIIAIVFVILFAIFCGIVIFLIWKLKQKQTHEAGRTQTSSSGYAQAGGDEDD